MLLGLFRYSISFFTRLFSSFFQTSFMVWTLLRAVFFLTCVLKIAVRWLNGNSFLSFFAKQIKTSNLQGSWSFSALCILSFNCGFLPQNVTGWLKFGCWAVKPDQLSLCNKNFCVLFAWAMFQKSLEVLRLGYRLLTLNGFCGTGKPRSLAVPQHGKSKAGRRRKNVKSDGLEETAESTGNAFS